MTNTKQLTGAVALLAAIAVIDNFIIVELDPSFEGMALVEASDSLHGNQNDETDIQAGDDLQEFWIDKQAISHTEFAKFLEETGREPQPLPSFKLQTAAIDSGHSAYLVDNDNWRSQADYLDWNESNASHPEHYIHQGQDDLKVSFIDAMAYCNWLGKELPTAEQAQHLASMNQDTAASEYYEFRCTKSI